MVGNQDSLFQCCFCGQPITAEQATSRTLEVDFGNGETQTLFCHALCLRGVVHSSVPLLGEDE